MKENIPRIFRKSKGQIVVEGDINLTSEDGVKIKHGKRFTLCGCTKSKNLPFCDGSHKTCLLYTSPSPRDKRQSRMPSSA